MKYRVPTVVVLESNDTYAHSAYGDSDIYVFQNDCLSRGLPDRDKEHVQEGFDHGALVLNRIIGKDIGLAPNARVIYVSSQSTGRGSFDRLKKLKSLLSYAQRHNMCIDAISISDTVSHVWRPELLLNETAAKQFGCLARSVLKMEPEDAEVKRLFDRFEQARKQASARNDYFLQDLREKEVQLRLDNLYRYVLKRSSDKYTNILFSLNILKDISVGHKSLMLSCEINNMLIKEQGAEPFIFPAMGSHGGATAEGQRELLAGFGITEETMVVPIKSSMETVRISVTPEGLPVHIDRNADAADCIIPLGRVKPHADFRGKIESGLMKMLTIGCGKQYGANLCHSLGMVNLS